MYPQLLQNIYFQVKKEASTRFQFSATFYLLTLDLQVYIRFALFQSPNQTFHWFLL